MDPTRFDTLTRSFATAGTRRRLLAILTALPLGGLLLGVGEDDVAAERPHERLHRRTKQHRRKRRNQHKHKKHHRKNHRHKGGKRGSNPGACTPNGKACNKNNDCCGGNCFNQVCTDPVSECAGVTCQAEATGCCPSGCCQLPTNQCNGVGECCAPNCDGRQCGPDGCGNSGTCGMCPSGSKCDTATGRCGCTPQTCPDGCCDDNGVCQRGHTDQACGTSGEACYACGSNQFCSAETGECRDNPPCSAETCANGCCNLENGFHVCRTDLRGCEPGGACCSGCCDENQECQPGNDDGVCGSGGSACIICDPLQGLCDQGRCQCDANNCPNGCCDNGPGNPGLCFVSDPRFCGTGGVQCLGCPEGTSCNGQGECQCLNTNEFCGVGEHCVACPDGTSCNAHGECVCTAESCPASSGRTCQNNQCLCDLDVCQGCCQDGLCKAGNTPQACLTQAGACTVCPSGQECVDSAFGLKACCPSGQISCYLDTCCPGNSFCCDGLCCASPCCEGGTACCPNGVDCCNDTCCTPGAAHCCDVEGNGDLQCVSVC